MCSGWKLPGRSAALASSPDSLVYGRCPDAAICRLKSGCNSTSSTLIDGRSGWIAEYSCAPFPPFLVQTGPPRTLSRALKSVVMEPGGNARPNRKGRQGNRAKQRKEISPLLYSAQNLLPSRLTFLVCL